MPIRVGIIGLSADPNAWTSAAHIAPLRGNLSSKYTVTALSTSSPETAAAAAEKWGLPKAKAYSSAEDIAKDPDVDLVVIGVKLPFHKDLALPALKAGKDVFVEWPLAFRDEIDELVQVAKVGGGRTVMGLQARTSPVIQKAKEIIDSGALGRIISTDILAIDNFMLYVPARYDYIRLAKNEANISTIAAGHTLDAMCFLLGEFSHLTAQAKVNFPVVNTPFHDKPVTRDAFDSLAVQGELESGATVTFHMFSTTPATKSSSFTWTITGEKGSLRLDSGLINIQMEPPKLYWQKGSEEMVVSNAEGVPMRDLYKDGGVTKDETWKLIDVDNPMAYGQTGEVYAAFADGEKIKGSLVDFEGAALRHRMLEACFKSSRDGTRETYRK